MRRFISVLLVPLAVLQAAAQGRVPDDVEAKRDVEYGVANDVSLTLDVYKPKKTPQGLMPAVVWIHGGGWRHGDKNNAGNAIALAKRGFFAVSINYRLSDVAVFPAAIEDCKGAIRWVRANAKENGVDPERIGVWGSSAGGHLALLAGCADESAGLEGKSGYAKVSSRVQAVCSWFGPADFRIVGSVARDPVAQFLGGTMEEKGEAYKLASPVTHASKDDPPVLMIHGDKDGTVKLEQSEVMLKALKEVGASAELVVVKNAGHGWKSEGKAVEPGADEIMAMSMKFFEEKLAAKEVQPGAEEPAKK
ncbi:MAG: peptidase S9 prolyl oligopeptidase active site domain-containing [Planctomycetota bacterium]|nr:MAG: peptidase S9 prolyl oligopeptidase active site domain-containing [Planctomycetota bacterium]